MGNDILACTDPSQNPPGVIAEKTFWRHFVAVLSALLRHRRKAITNLYALDRINTHQSVGQLSVQTIKDWFAQTRLHTVCHYTDLSANGFAFLDQVLHVGFQLRNFVRIWTKKGVVINNG